MRLFFCLIFADMKLGDAIEKVTAVTGIKAVVEKVSEITGKDCGCAARKESLNKVFEK